MTKLAKNYFYLILIGLFATLVNSACKPPADSGLYETATESDGCEVIINHERGQYHIRSYSADHKLKSLDKITQDSTISGSIDTIQKGTFHRMGGGDEMAKFTFFLTMNDGEKYKTDSVSFPAPETGASEIKIGCYPLKQNPTIIQQPQQVTASLKGSYIGECRKKNFYNTPIYSQFTVEFSENEYNSSKRYYVDESCSEFQSEDEVERYQYELLMYDSGTKMGSLKVKKDYEEEMFTVFKLEGQILEQDMLHSSAEPTEADIKDYTFAKKRIMHKIDSSETQTKPMIGVGNRN